LGPICVAVLQIFVEAILLNMIESAVGSHRGAVRVAYVPLVRRDEVIVDFSRRDLENVCVYSQ